MLIEFQPSHGAPARSCVGLGIGFWKTESFIYVNSAIKKEVISLFMSPMYPLMASGCFRYSSTVRVEPLSTPLSSS